jgi:isocitrate dehydrogenase
VGTKGFAVAVIERLGRRPTKFTPVEYAGGPPIAVAGRVTLTHPARKELVGVDVFLHWRGPADALGEQLARVNGDGLTLSMISNRGVKVWPNGMPETFCTDHWRCRFKPREGESLRISAVLALLQAAYHLGNRHVAVEIGTGALRLLDDPVLAHLLEHRGLRLCRVAAPFYPEAGAYEHGH